MLEDLGAAFADWMQELSEEMAASCFEGDAAVVDQGQDCWYEEREVCFQMSAVARLCRRLAMIINGFWCWKNRLDIAQ